MKKTLCILLSLVILFSTVLLVPNDAYAYYVSASATNDYTTWKQTSSTWGEATPWPNADRPKFGDAGCWITSVAILLRHYGVVNESDVNKFNPLICNNQLMKYDVIDTAGDWHNLDKMSSAYPGFSYVGEKGYSFSTLKSLYEQGYACIVHETREEGHYVAVKSVSSSGVVVMDPGCNTTNLTNSDKIQYFKVKPAIKTPTGSQVIADGTYHIISALNESYGLDVTNGKGVKGANIQIYKNIKDSKQTFNIKHTGNGYYIITSTIGNKVLDVDNAGVKDGTNVQIWDSNDTAAQRWVFKDAGDGYLYIISKCNGLYLDVDNANVANGTNVHMWKSNGTKAQKWKIISTEKGSKTISEGDYHIVSSKNSSYGLDISNASNKAGANVQLYKNSKDYKQIFHVKYIGNGIYEIYSDNSNLSLDVSLGAVTKGSNVQVFTRNSTLAQKWRIKSAGNGNYYIINTPSNLFLDVADGRIENSVNIRMWIGNNTAAQKWKFIKVSAPSKTELTSVKSSNKKTVSVKWKAVSGAEGYEVQYSTTSKFSKNIYSKRVTSSSMSYRKCKSGKRYYVRVRAYKRAGKKYLNSSWSKKKSVKSK